MMVKVFKESLYFSQVEQLVLPDYTVSLHFPAFVLRLPTCGSFALFLCSFQLPKSPPNALFKSHFKHWFLY